MIDGRRKSSATSVSAQRHVGTEHTLEKQIITEQIL